MKKQLNFYQLVVQLLIVEQRNNKRITIMVEESIVVLIEIRNMVHVQDGLLFSHHPYHTRTNILPNKRRFMVTKRQKVKRLAITYMVTKR